MKFKSVIIWPDVLLNKDIIIENFCIILLDKVRHMSYTIKMKIPLVDLSIQYQGIKKEADQSITRAIKRGHFILGEEVGRFENNFANFLGVKKVVALNSGTDALFLSLKALGIKQEDEIITTPLSFFATAEAVCQTGAKPVFVDVNEKTYNINEEIIKDAVTAKTKAIIVVHLYGLPCDMKPILNLAKKYNLFVIEDACQAHGAEYFNKKAGGLGHLGCFSFYPGKNLGAYGDAGAVAANNLKLAKNIAELRNHGRAKKYTHKFVGENSRMDEIQGAILNIKLKYLPQWNEQRRKAAALYYEKLKNVKDITLPNEPENFKHVYHLFVIKVKNRDKILKTLKEKGVDAGIHYPIPLHLQPALKFLNYKRGDFPVAEKVAKEILSLPIYPEITENQINYIVKIIKNELSK